MSVFKPVYEYDVDEAINIEVLQNPDDLADKHIIFMFYLSAYGVEMRQTGQHKITVGIIVNDRRADDWVLASEYTDYVFHLEVWKHPRDFHKQNVFITIPDSFMIGMGEGEKTLRFRTKSMPLP